MKGALLVREARLRAGLSQAQLAVRIGASRQRISRWETGASPVTFDDAERVFAACDLDLVVGLRPRDHETRAMLDTLAPLTPDQLIDQLVAWQEFRASGSSRSTS